MPVNIVVFLRTLQTAILFDVLISKLDDGTESLSANLSVTPNWAEMVNLLEGRTAIQKNLDKLKEWTELGPLQQEEQVMHVRWSNLMQQYRPIAAVKEPSPWRDLGVLVDDKLNISQQSTQFNPGRLAEE